MQCGKSFARTDVLQRHLKIHERDRRPADNHGAAAGQQTEGSSGTGGGSYTRVRGLNRVSRGELPAAAEGALEKSTADRDRFPSIHSLPLLRFCQGARYSPLPSWPLILTEA